MELYQGSTRRVVRQSTDEDGRPRSSFVLRAPVHLVSTDELSGLVPPEPIISLCGARVIYVEPLRDGSAGRCRACLQIAEQEGNWPHESLPGTAFCGGGSMPDDDN